MTKFLLASRSVFCTYHLTKDYLKCDAKEFDIEQRAYCLTFSERHLEFMSFDCGCKICHNKYYSELNFSSPIWNDLIGFSLSPGEKNTKVFLSLKENRKSK